MTGDEREALRWLYVATHGCMDPPKWENHWGHIHEAELGMGPHSIIMTMEQWSILLERLKKDNIVCHGRDYRWDVHIAEVWKMIHEEEEEPMPIIWGFYSQVIRNIAKLVKKNGEIPRKAVVTTYEQLLEAADHIDKIETMLDKPHIHKAQQENSLEELRKINDELGETVKDFAKIVTETDGESHGS